MTIEIDRLIEVLIRALPYAEQITDLDTVAEDDAIRFTWRSQRFRASTNLSVDTVQGSMLHGDDISILLACLLKRTLIDMESQRAKKAATL